MKPKIGQSFIPILKDCDEATLLISTLTGKIRKAVGRRVLDRDGEAFVCSGYDSNSTFAMDLTPEAGNYTDGWHWKNVWGENVRRDGGKVPDEFYNKPFRREFRNEHWEYLVII